MADYEEVLSRVCKEKLSGLLLKPEQKKAIISLLNGKDVFAVLPTGFGKSLIYQSFVFSKEIIHGHSPSVIVVIPLRSIVQEQLTSNEFNLKAVELSLQDDVLKNVSEGEVEVVYASAENVLNDKFLSILRDSNSPFRRRLKLIVVDESHTVFTWGKGSKKGKKAFREDYGSLSVLRSFCGGTPVLALTGTADDRMTARIKRQLAMSRTTCSIILSPERANIRHTVMKVTKNVYLQHFRWVAEMVKTDGVNTPKTIIFCTSLSDVAKLVSNLFAMLGDALYEPGKPHHPSNRLVGIYHAHTHSKYKERVLSSFKSLSGTIRVVIATTALGMGVNFPDIKYIVHAGPERSLVDYIQAAGRAGRNGERAHDVVIYHGNQLAQCAVDVKEFVPTDGCIREALFRNFSSNVLRVQPLHDCCSNCAAHCNCQQENCEELLPFLKPTGGEEENLNLRESDVTSEERKTFKKALMEEKARLDLGQQSVFEAALAHGFSTELVRAVTADCEHIFTVDYLTENLPIFNIKHAVTILEYIHEIFEDIPAITELSEMFPHPAAQTMELAQYDLFHFEEAESSQSEDEDWINSEELQNI